MEFDKSKVFTVVNADELKLGSIGYFANSLQSLETQVEQEEDTATTLIGVVPGNNYPFIEESENKYCLFYLVEEPEEKKYRPYKDGDEFIADFKRRWEKYSGVKFHENAMSLPFIWLKPKVDEWGELVPHIDEYGIFVNNVPYTFDEIFDDFTYLDGSPCGIEEKTK